MTRVLVAFAPGSVTRSHREVHDVRGGKGAPQLGRPKHRVKMGSEREDLAHFGRCVS